MDPAYLRLRAEARRIAAELPRPAFYRELKQAYDRSRQFFETDPTIRRLYHHVIGAIGPSLGHGIGHATAVSVDAGCLVLVEPFGATAPAADPTLLRLAQSAGLLHDICRTEKDHAAAGAAAAESLLAGYPFSPEEIQGVCEAIRRHVAFQDLPQATGPVAELIANCLYDADKFRWGPDNFTHTVWDMIADAAIPPKAFAERYDSGIRYVQTISTTFRTVTGQKYGPEFIDQGMTIARHLKPCVEAALAGKSDNR